jgi:UDP-N-acetylglucosamine 4,6-dehydratase
VFKPTALKRGFFFLFFDIFLSISTLFLAYNLRFNFDIPAPFLENFFDIFLLILVLKISLLAFYNVYQVIWRFFSLKEAKKIFYAHVITYGLLTSLYYINPDYFMPFPRSVIVIDLFLSMIFLGSLRVLKRLFLEEYNNTDLKKTMLIGVTPYAQVLIKQKNEFYIDAIVDDVESSIGSYFSNIKVKSFENIEEIVIKQSIKSVIITKKLDQVVLKDLYDRLHKVGIKDILITSLGKDETRIKNLGVEDLLARHPKDLDKEKIASFVRDKTILVTGAGGSIGSEICRQCQLFGAKELILLDNSEFNLYTITEELSNIKTISVMQSVVNLEAIEKTFSLYKPEIVIHAAAYKHVPLVEGNIQEGIVNNVVGTKNVIDTSIKYGVKKFVLISTDKAVRPTNVMGTTKRICELYAQNVLSNETEIVAVRFGNVLGSSGSVIPKFKAQIEAGKNITVTDPEITRYFMLVSEACELVLQAGAIGEGGEIFILDMGEPVKIVDLANKMIDLSDRDEIEIEFTGLRPGEKLYEELLIDESNAETQYESITIAKPIFYDIDKLKNDIDELLIADDKLAKLKTIVPEFKHRLN